MLPKCAIVLLLLSSLANALHVIQWQDNMILSNGSFLELTNKNVASKISERQPSLKQNFVFNLVNKLPFILLMMTILRCTDEQLPKLRVRCAYLPCS